MSSNETGLSTGQIIAIVASAVTVATFLIATLVAVRCYRRQQRRDIKEIPKRELGTSSDSTVSQIEQGSTDEPRDSVSDTTRSSIWGDTRGSIVAPASIFNGDDDVWDSRQWPLPPGHSERYTFFSERSSVTIDEIVEIEQLGDGDHNGNTAGRRSNMESRYDSIREISEVGMAHGGMALFV
ncbi:hypothetical protein F5Y00DRAFT_243778 [Daldinia vernicosa]|uniref:uncharacterized protein n=1 Tax=Daldinia vernicosa TaxID=114800 RepID=UPI0020080C76|nr:uncharacterized protein F5Y00DRAFT_243778 [Daldinia vernicosa]KAI0846507.1 hypothetical protein F5Y00DRAFT_243778 [Daldinia vernicosa]